MQLSEPYIVNNQMENKGTKDYKKEIRQRKKIQWYSAEKKKKPTTKQLLAGGIPSLTLVLWESLFLLIRSLASKEALKPCTKDVVSNA